MCVLARTVIMRSNAESAGVLCDDTKQRLHSLFNKFKILHVLWKLTMWFVLENACGKTRWKRWQKVAIRGHGIEMTKNNESEMRKWSIRLHFILQKNFNLRSHLFNFCLEPASESLQSWSWSKKRPTEEMPIHKRRRRRQPEKNSKPYGKKCKCGHFESDHVNLTKKFYEPNAIPEMGVWWLLQQQLTIPKPYDTGMHMWQVQPWKERPDVLEMTVKL